MVLRWDSNHMTDWRALASELDAWQRLGRVATLWWRDDDAAEVTSALKKLTQLSKTCRTPVACAVIPMSATRELAGHLGQCPGCSVLQHGYRHQNHAPARAKKSEFGKHRATRDAVLELKRGFSTMTALFGSLFLPVLVPPWNRLDAALLPVLADCGFRGLSTYAPRPRARPADGVCQTNCHVDLIDWRGGRGFKGHASVLAELTGHLAARRKAEVDVDEPTGILSHHLDHDTASWDFLEELFDRTNTHPAADWLDGRRALWPS